MLRRGAKGYTRTEARKSPACKNGVAVLLNNRRSQRLSDPVPPAQAALILGRKIEKALRTSSLQSNFVQHSTNKWGGGSSFTEKCILLTLSKK